MSDDEQENVEHHDDDHDPSFKPIVELAPVTIPTLEENEDVLYVNEHTRLYRFIKPVLSSTDDSPNTSSQDSHGEWKERGTGEIKVLRNRTTSRCRVVMRREKTLKVCANHYLTAEMQIDRLPGKLSAQTCLWYTPADFSDGESHSERFCLRFRTPDEANDFRQVFDSAKTSPASTSSTNDSQKTQQHHTDAKSDGADVKQAESEVKKPSEDLSEKLSTLTVASDEQAK